MFYTCCTAGNSTGIMSKGALQYESLSLMYVPRQIKLLRAADQNGQAPHRKEITLKGNINRVY